VTFLDFDLHEASLIAALDGDRLHAKLALILTISYPAALPKGVDVMVWGSKAVV
jgi:hypothetical protein